jgi:guanylate kinase
MNKRLILVGPTCSGKTHLRKRMEERGFRFNISYTTRPPRPGEAYGVDYNFISVDEFTLRIAQGAFYEWAPYDGHYYGTGLYEWNNFDGFVMETEGVLGITPADRQRCFVIYIDTPAIDRANRMLGGRGWSEEEMEKRISEDNEKFKDFIDYDIRITNSDF